MTKSDENELIMQTVRWMLDFNEAVVGAGGNPRYIIDMFSAEQLVNFVRNNLHIRYIPPKAVSD